MGNACGRRNKDGAVSNGGWEPPPEDEGFFLRDGEIVITTFPKCGTTWMQYIVLTLLYKGDASKIVNMDIQSPFLEDMAKGKGKDKDKDKDGKGKDKDKKGKDKKGKDKKGKGKDPEEEKMLRELIAWDGSSWFGSRPTPSVYKTHKMPDSVLWEGGIKEIAHCKCIVVTRNPKDAMISLYRQEHDNSPPTFGGGPIHRAVVRLGRAFHHCLQGSWRAAARLLLEVARRVVEGEGDIPGQRPVDILRGLEEGQPCSG
ncbi:unnamed protein product, partial [Prorocentrum cordatum]